MKLNKLLSAVAAAGFLVAVGSAQASISFTFDPDGAGAGFAPISGAGILDQAAGNTLAINGAGGGAALANGTVLTDLYQSNLTAVQTSGAGNLFSNGDGGNYFTFVSSFTEVVTGGASGATFAFNAFSVVGGTFKMCAQSSLGDNLTGSGFSCAGNGILSGRIASGNAAQTVFFDGPVALDQSGATDDWPGVTTLTSSGSAQLIAVIETVDAAYFPDLLSGTQLTFAAVNSSLITPFRQVDPSRAFSSDGVANADRAADIGALNGITGPDFLFQSDANASFDRVIPEPGSLALAGLALAGLSMVGRRRNRK